MGARQRAWRFVFRQYGWAYLIVAGLWLAAGTYVLTAQDVAKGDPFKTPERAPVVGQTISLGEKSVTYEVTSPTNSAVTVSYLDELGHAQLFNGPTPWRRALTTSDIAFAAGVTAISASGTLTCRISVDGAVTDEQADAGPNPTVRCNLIGFQKLSAPSP